MSRKLESKSIARNRGRDFGEPYSTSATRILLKKLKWGGDIQYKNMQVSINYIQGQVRALKNLFRL